MSCENCEESAYVIDKLAKLLAEIAVIVNGPEPSLTSWSYHDLPEKVRALREAQPAAVPAPPQGPVSKRTDYVNGYDEGWNACLAAQAQQPAAAVPADPLSQEALLRRIAELQAPPAALAVPDDAMVERALKVLAFEDDGAVFPDAYSDEEADAEREKMRKALAAALAQQPAALADRVQQVVAEMLAIAPTCENDWEQQLREWAAMLAAAERKGGES